MRIFYATLKLINYSRRGTGSNLPMAMKYRTLKETYKKNVGVYRSHIHGRGLFCTRDIEAGKHKNLSHFNKNLNFHFYDRRNGY